MIRVLAETKGSVSKLRLKMKAKTRLVNLSCPTFVSVHLDSLGRTVKPVLVLCTSIIFGSRFT